ncbi:MAG: Lrp/AsnC family transcriptional regulator [Candidatus Woesearchaeota archaeon]
MDFFKGKLGLDQRDYTIISLLQENPRISQEEIARKIKLSQPSVGARIKKLSEKGIITLVNGVNFKVVDLFLAKVDVYASDTKAVLEEFEGCPYFINGLVISGRYNLCLLFVSTDLKCLEGIVNTHLRDNSNVRDVEMNIVISTAKDLILPLNFSGQSPKCNRDCQRF